MTAPSMLKGVCCAVFMGTATLAMAAGNTPADFPEKMDAFLSVQEQSPYNPPNYSLMVASGDTLLYSRQHGESVVGMGELLTADTPLYIASVTKSFVGLLAAKLDADGILPLGATLAEVWPGLELPEGLDAGAITMADLLSHTSGLENDPLVVLTAYIGGTDTPDYEAVLESQTKAVGRDFKYGNIGYLVYAAALEKHTGRGWKDWLKGDVFTPLGLGSATARPSDISDGTIGLGNHFAPNSKTGWVPAPAKADDLMHPAGGMFLSSNDAVRWLQANLKRSGLSGAVYEAAQTPRATLAKPKKYGDMTCSGYGLGLYTCDYAGRRVLYHGGTYDGMMIFMAFLPDDDLVVSSINGARAYGWTFGLNGLQQAIDYALGLEGADSNAEKRTSGRVASQNGYANHRVKIREDVFRQATGAEAAALRAELIGGYTSPGYGDASVCDLDGKLMLIIGRFSAEMLAVGADKAVLMERAYGEPQKLDITRDETTGAPSFEWEGGSFTRTSRDTCLGGEGQSR